MSPLKEKLLFNEIFAILPSRRGFGFKDRDWGNFSRPRLPKSF
jgi:hypothetical protein